MPPCCGAAATGERGPRGAGRGSTRGGSRHCGFWGTWAGSWGAIGCGRPPPVPVPAAGMLCVMAVRGAGGHRHPHSPWVPWFFGVRRESPLGWAQPPAPTMALVPSMSPSPPLCAVPRCQRVSLATGPLGHRSTIHSRHRAGVAGTAGLSPWGTVLRAWPAGPPCPHGLQGAAGLSPRGMGRGWHSQDIPTGPKAWP